MRLARIGWAGLAGFVGIVAVEHLLRPDLPPAEHFVSEYGVGSTRLLQSAAFVAWGVGTAALTGLVGDAARRTRGGRRVAFAVATTCLAAAAVGCFVMALYATETVAGRLPEGVERTTGGRLHDVGSLLVLAGLFLAAIAVAAGLHRRGHVLRVAGLAVLLFAIVPVLMALGVDAPGWGQRGFIAVGCAWQALALRDVTSLRLTRQERVDRKLAA